MVGITPPIKKHYTPLTLEQFYAEWNNASPHILVHTSGSTGKPKPIKAEKMRMLASARQTCDFLSLHPGDTALLCMPLDYIAGKMVVVRSIERGLRLLSVPPSNHPLRDILPHPSADGEACSPPSITFAAMVPSQVFCSLSDPEEKALFSQIRHVIIGGGAISPELSSMLRDMPNNIWSTYGMTETLSHIALRRVNGREASEWYEPFPSVRVSLCHDAMLSGRKGLLVIDAPAICDSPLLTNDICELHSDGHRFRVLGRKDNVICSGGIKLQIEEIEKALSRKLPFPFCITKRHDAKFGEIAVLLAAIGDDVEAQEKAKASCASAFLSLPRYSVPKDIVFCCAIPLTATGKIDRAACAELCSHGGL